MKRFFAKLFIQYFRDSKPFSAASPVFPSWLARWIDRDAELQRSVQELTSFEQTLARQASELVSESKRSLAPAADPIRVSTRVDSPTQPNRNRMLVWGSLALAASVFLVFYFRTTSPSVSPSSEGGLASAPRLNDVTRDDKAKYQNWIRSRLEAGKRLKSRLDEKRELAQQQIENLDLTLRNDQELLVTASRNGLKFFGQKLPAATVRMLGLNQVNQLASR